MANVSGDPFLKLPPIKQEDSIATSSDVEDLQTGRGLHRDKHGLIRLPPIVRLNSLRDPAVSQKHRSSTNESRSVTKKNILSVEPNRTESNPEKSRRSPTSSAKKISVKNVESLKPGGVKKDTNYDSLDDEQTGTPVNVSKATEGISHPQVREERDNFGPFLSNSGEFLLPSEQSATFYNEERTNRRESTSYANSMKLKRSSRLAKSSPELSYKRMLRMRAEETLDSALTSQSVSPLALAHRITERRLSIHDIDGALFTCLDKPGITKDKKQERRKVRRRNQTGDISRQPHSSPCSPICSETTSKQKQYNGRKSLNDISDFGQFLDRERVSISTPKKLNLMKDTNFLKIEGISCPQNERETARSRTPKTAGHRAESRLASTDKRPSMHDLQQILNILQNEDFNQPSSSSSQSHEINDKSVNASVYDLREFLTLAAEAASSKQPAIKTSKQFFLVPSKDVGGGTTSRKGSVYDLMEFLSLGSGENSTSTSQNSSRAASPRTANNSLSSGELNTQEPRRTSRYNLTEFLSLPRSEGATQSNTSPNENRVVNHEPSAGLPGFGNKDGNRSLSVYDLAEFLSMTSGIPPLIKVQASDKQQTVDAMSTETGGDSIIDKKASVHDLKESLGVLLQDQDATQSNAQNLRAPAPSTGSRRGSTYNLQEILSHLQREAEESKLADAPESTSAVEKRAVSTHPPSMTANSDFPRARNGSSTKPLSTDTNDYKRNMSVYNLKEFLSLHSPNQPSLSPVYSRKFSGVSQSGVSIQVTDENNESLDHVFSDSDDVFQPTSESVGGNVKRTSVYDLREFLTLLNTDDSPLRRRLSSISSNTSSSCSDNTVSSEQPDGGKGNPSRPQLCPRQDSGGNLSLYDLDEFLSLLNTEESPLRRRLSSVGSNSVCSEVDQGAKTSPADSEKGLYNLEEILTVLNEFEQKRNNEKTPISEENEHDGEKEISIQVPHLPSVQGRSDPQRFRVKKEQATSRSPLNNISESQEVKPRLSL